MRNSQSTHCHFFIIFVALMATQHYSNPSPETPPKAKRKVVRALYIVAGSLCLGLAILGIFVPGLPTTPLALLSAWLYAKSSDRLYKKLLDNKYLGPKIRDYHRKKGVTRRGKINILLLMSTMVLISSFVIVRDNLTVRYIILTLGLIGGLVVWFWVPNAKDDDYPSSGS